MHVLAESQALDKAGYHRLRGAVDAIINFASIVVTVEQLFDLVHLARTAIEHHSQHIIEFAEIGVARHIRHVTVRIKGHRQTIAEGH